MFFIYFLVFIFVVIVYFTFCTTFNPNAIDDNSLMLVFLSFMPVKLRQADNRDWQYTSY